MDELQLSLISGRTVSLTRSKKCNYFIRLIQPQIKDSEDSSAQTEYRKMNISLFSKPYITKACYLFVILSLIAGSPLRVDAGFFSDLKTMVLGTSATAEEIVIPESNNIYNSQTVPLLESSINPDFKNIDEQEDVVVVQDDSFIYSDSFLGASDLKYEKSSVSDKIVVYTVQDGDTLSEIAESFDVSMNTIRWENNLSGQTISVGQKLNILPVTGVKHIVKKGDTISKIADKYDAELEDTLIFNGLSKGDGLKQGDIIFVPNGIIKPAVVVNKKPSSGGNTGGTLASNTKAPSGYYIRPSAGIITSPYGSRRGGFHYGVDIGNKRGTPIVAAASGVVTKVVAGCKEGVSNCGGRYGNYVVIQHSNGTKTFYAHLSSVSVSVGQSVSQGQKIGGMGSTGRSTGSHLHFEVENANGSKMRPPV